MVQTAFYSAAKPIVLVHAVAAIVLASACSYQFALAIAHLRRRPKIRWSRIYAATVAVSYLVTTILGALEYPTYRYFVRNLYLDRYAPWASNLFAIKENVTTVGVPLVIAAWGISRILDAESDRIIVAGYATLVTFSAAIVWFDVLAGALVTLMRGVP